MPCMSLITMTSLFVWRRFSSSSTSVSTSNYACLAGPKRGWFSSLRASKIKLQDLPGQKYLRMQKRYHSRLRVLFNWAWSRQTDEDSYLVEERLKESFSGLTMHCTSFKKALVLLITLQGGRSAYASAKRYDRAVWSHVVPSWKR